MKYLAALIFLISLPAYAVEGLPLPEGYYVPGGVKCSEATDADVALVHANGINVPNALCEFEAVSKTTEEEYSFAATCAHPEQRQDYLNEGTITIFGPATFRFNDGQTQAMFDYCTPDSLPANMR